MFSEVKIRETLHDLLPVLQFIHDHNIIHRDLKPDNIIRRQQDGRLVLIDFGVAKLLAQTGILQPGSTIVGSTGYAPPEQMQGRVTPASDLFSLGVTCFHLLTKSKVDQLFERQGYDWVNNWQQHLKFSFSQESVHVLDRLLQPEERYRYQTANQVLRDLPTNASTLPTNPVSPHQSTPLPTYSSVQPTIAAMPLSQPLAANQQSLVRPSQVGWSFFFKWIIASFIGVTVGAVVLVFWVG